jgi:hypothetical protein
MYPVEFARYLTEAVPWSIPQGINANTVTQTWIVMLKKRKITTPVERGPKREDVFRSVADGARFGNGSAPFAGKDLGPLAARL